MTARVWAGGAVLAAALFLAACGGETGGTPIAGDGSGSAAPTSDSGASSGAAPPVSDPLEATALVSTPCDALSSSDRSRLGFDEGEDREISTEVDALACSWHYAETSGNRVDLSVTSGTQRGLSTIYEKQSQYGYFEPTEISGYPAVYASTLDNRDDGECGLWVGVSDQTMLFIMSNLDDQPDFDDPCGVADRVAEAAIANLGG